MDILCKPPPKGGSVCDAIFTNKKEAEVTVRRTALQITATSIHDESNIFPASGIKECRIETDYKMSLFSPLNLLYPLPMRVRNRGGAKHHFELGAASLSMMDVVISV